MFKEFNEPKGLNFLDYSSYFLRTLKISFLKGKQILIKHDVFLLMPTFDISFANTNKFDYLVFFRKFYNVIQILFCTKSINFRFMTFLQLILQISKSYQEITSSRADHTF